MSFACAEAVEIENSPLPVGRRRSAPLPPFVNDEDADLEPQPISLKVSKFGLLSRKDDLLAGGKRAGNRKWREWSVMLTGSQLLFFRDPVWIAALKDEMRRGSVEEGGGGVKGWIFPFAKTSTFRPDEILSVKDAIALFDTSYNKVSSHFICEFL